MSVINQLTRFETVQHTQPALLPVPFAFEPAHDGETAKLVMTPPKNVILIPAVVLISTDKCIKNSKDTVNLAEPLSFSMLDTDVAFMARPTYHKSNAYEKSAKVMHTAVAFFDIGAGASLIQSALIMAVWKNGVSKESIPRLRTATTQPPQIERLILIRLRVGDLCTRV